MSLKCTYETLEINGMPIADAIVALQAWKDKNPEAVHDYLSVDYDGDNIEVNFQRPMTEKELEEYNAQLASYAQRQEEQERKTYERLKAKYEGN